MTEEKTRGCIIRSRVRWPESGEKWNKYFRRPFEKKLQQKSHKKIEILRRVYNRGLENYLELNEEWITTNNYILPTAKPPLAYYQTFLILDLSQDYKMSHKVPLSVNEIKKEILWNNHFIKIGQESHYGSWIGWKTVFL